MDVALVYIGGGGKETQPGEGVVRLTGQITAFCARIEGRDRRMQSILFLCRMKLESNVHISPQMYWQ